MTYETYLTRARFERGCAFTGDHSSWCTDAETRSEVRPGTPGTAEYVAREQRDAKAAAMIGRDHTDLPCCHKHAKERIENESASEIWTFAHVERVVFAGENPASA